MPNCNEKIDIDSMGPNIKVVSFDVFDTVVTRNIGEPQGIFFRIQKRIYESNNDRLYKVMQDFVQIRINAEQRARQMRMTEDITIYEIYRIIKNQFYYSDEDIKSLIKLELAEELESVVPVVKILHFIDALREKQKRIIFVSDMYLPSSIIKDMLIKVDAYRNNDGVYVSSESGVTKATGNMYLRILEAEKCSPAEICHVGDNKHSDFAMARHAAGIKAIHFTESKLNRYETILLQGDKNDHALFWQQVAGASRTARLTADTGYNDHEAALYSIGTNIAGPILTGFVLWILKSATLKGIDRLYFISRDGQVLLEIARKLSKKLNCNIELRYLFGSRQAWHLPSITKLTERELNWIALQDPVLTLRIIARRVGLKPEFLQEQLHQHNIVFDGLDVPLRSEEIQYVSQCIIKEPLIRDTIIKTASQSREIVISYLRQEGLFDEVSWGIVDLGWLGRIQDSLLKILNAGHWNGRMNGFYFGLFQRETNSDNEKLSYFFGPELAGNFRESGSSFIEILEVLSSADHGMTMSYHMAKNDRVIPILNGNDLAKEWGLDALRLGIGRFVDKLEIDPADFDEREYRMKTHRLIHIFYRTPSLVEAIAMGKYMFSSDQTETTLKYLAPPLTLIQSFCYHLEYSTAKKRGYTYWIYASRVQSKLIVRIFLSSVSILLKAIPDFIRITYKAVISVIALFGRLKKIFWSLKDHSNNKQSDASRCRS